MSERSTVRTGFHSATVKWFGHVLRTWSGQSRGYASRVDAAEVEPNCLGSRW